MLAQAPGFKPKHRGLKDKDEFLRECHRLGNLTLVEKAINSAAQGKTPEQNATDDRLYKKSSYASTRKLGAHIATENQAGRHFDSDGVKVRSDELVDFCVGRWPLW